MTIFFPTGKFSVIYADPPWKFRSWSALEVGETWGFRFKTTSFTWCKTTPSGGWHIGLGYWTRGNPEQCLLFTRGAPRRRSAAARQS
jgi:N6-adenosine-specific RNA methylase IME4